MENKNKFTPGPWRVKKDDSIVVGPLGNIVAECCGYSVKVMDKDLRRQGGREANARLIAAAPDMLEALQLAIYEVEGFQKRTGVLQFMPWIGMTRRAISKALGE